MTATNATPTGQLTPDELTELAQLVSMGAALAPLLASPGAGRDLALKHVALLSSHVDARFPAQAAAYKASVAANSANQKQNTQAWFHNLWLSIFIRTAQHYPGLDQTKYLDQIQSQLPAGGCKCKGNFAQWRKDNPPDFSTAETWFAWWVELKNKINVDNGQQTLTVAQAHAVWDPLVAQALAAPAAH
jgi:hypothetical protein